MNICCEFIGFGLVCCLDAAGWTFSEFGVFRVCFGLFRVVVCDLVVCCLIMLCACFGLRMGIWRILGFDRFA